MKEKKIIGITKINIPSTNQKIVPYYVLLIQNEKGQLELKKSFKKFFIRKFNTNKFKYSTETSE